MDFLKNITKQIIDFFHIHKKINHLSDLRKIKNYENGQTVYVKRHSDNQFVKDLGKGYFTLDLEPEFITTEVISNFSHGSKRIIDFKFTQAKRTLPFHTNSGVCLISNKGVIIKVTAINGSTVERDYRGEQVYVSRLGGICKGDTSFTGRAEQVVNDEFINSRKPTPNPKKPNIEEGDKWYLLDDDGIFINLYKEGKVIGLWEREIKDGYVNPEMYGATPYKHPKVFRYLKKEGKELPCDGDKIQKAFDNIFYNFQAKNGFYYTNKTIVGRVHKKYNMEFSRFHTTARSNYWNAYSGFIFTDNPNIDVLELSGVILENSTFNTDTSIVEKNSDNNHITINLRDSSLNRFRSCEFNMIGNDKISSLDNIHNGLVVDDRNRNYATREGDGGGSYGTLHSSNFNVRFRNVNKGIWVTDSEDKNTSINGVTINILDALICKQFIVTDRRIDNSDFHLNIFQMTNSLSYQEAKTLPAVKLISEGAYIDGFFMDTTVLPEKNPYLYINLKDKEITIENVINYVNSLNTPIELKKSGHRTINQLMVITNDKEEEKVFTLDKRSKDGLYGNGYLNLKNNDLKLREGKNLFRNENLLDLRGMNIILGSALKKSLKTHNEYKYSNIQAIQATVDNQVTNSEFYIPKYSNPIRQNSLISKLDNAFMFALEDAREFYVKGFNANNINLNELTEKSDGVVKEHKSIIIENPEAFNNYRDNDFSAKETLIKYKDVDINNSYVEFYYQGKRFTGEDVCINLRGFTPKEVHFLETDTNGKANSEIKIVKFTHDRRPSHLAVRFKKSDSGGQGGYIIRLVGIAAKKGETTYSGSGVLDDVLITHKTKKYLPFLHREGNQEVLGDMKFKNNASPVIERNGNFYKLDIDEKGNPIFIRQ